ncbi:MAG: hypothetical protein OHK0026_11290 [Rhodocyclaceae bacterium]
MTRDSTGDIQGRSLDAAMRLAQLSMENSKRIMALQAETARALFEASLESARALAAAKDPNAALELRTEYSRATTAKMMDAASQIARIAAETQSEFGRLIADQLAGGSKEMMEAMQRGFAFDPAAAPAAENALGAFEQAIATAREAFEQLTRTSAETFASFAGTRPRKPGGKSGT